VDRNRAVQVHSRERGVLRVLGDAASLNIVEMDIFSSISGAQQKEILRHGVPQKAFRSISSSLIVTKSLIHESLINLPYFFSLSLPLSLSLSLSLSLCLSMIPASS